jgi:hypothetical protein
MRCHLLLSLALAAGMASSALAGGTTTTTESTTSTTESTTTTTETSTTTTVPTTTTTGAPTTTTTLATTTTSTSTTTTTTTTTTASSTTTTGPVVTTSTTLPDVCAGVVSGPSFRSISCRLAALVGRVQGEVGLGSLGAKLLAALGKATTAEQTAESQCVAGQTAQSKAQLKQVVRQVMQYGHRLRTRGARKQVVSAIRNPLIQAGDAIRLDTRALRVTVHCP